MTKVDVLLGLQWGDEGKGKIVDCLAPQYDMIARFQGGPNAGHTLVINGQKHVLHTIPSGIFHDKPINLIGNGVVINPITLLKEIQLLEEKGVNVKDKLFISNRASLILPTHKILDAASEHQKGRGKIGSTLRGIGPTYMDKTGRNGLRMGDVLQADFDQKYQALKEKHLTLLSIYDFKYQLDEEDEWMNALEQLKEYKIVNSEYLINDYLSGGKKVLAEGAQGSLLDIDFGTYPFVTSSNTISSSACNGLGVAPSKIGEVIGIAKAYCTRVGAGPFPTELEDETGEKLRQTGHEFGATTGRPRRCGWLDLPALKYTAMLSGLTNLVITKVDVLSSFDEIKLCTDYQYDGKLSNELPYDLTHTHIEPVYKTFEGWQTDLSAFGRRHELPEKLQDYFSFIENYLKVRIGIISHAPDREKLILAS